MNPRAGRDRHIGRGNGYATRSGAAGERICIAPDVVVNRQHREDGREVAKRPLLPVAACAIPQLELNDWAPARLPRLEGSLDTATDRRIAVWTQEVNPGRGVNQGQWPALAAGAAPEARPPSSSPGRSRRT